MNCRFYYVLFLASVSLCLANPVPQMYGSNGIGYQPPIMNYPGSNGIGYQPPVMNYPGRVNTRTVQNSYGPYGQTTVVRQQSSGGLGSGRSTTVVRQQSAGGIGYGGGQYPMNPHIQNPPIY